MDKTKLFVIWLDGFLESSDSELNLSRTNAIKNKLNGLFEHEADKLETSKLSLEELGEQHGFPVYQGFPGSEQIGGTGPNGEVYRC